MDRDLDVRRVRGLLAEARVTHTAYARACKLARVYLGHILSGRVQPGELAVIKMRRGLAAFGLNEEIEARRAC